MQTKGSAPQNTEVCTPLITCVHYFSIIFICLHKPQLRPQLPFKKRVAEHINHLNNAEGLRALKQILVLAKAAVTLVVLALEELVHKELVLVATLAEGLHAVAHALHKTVVAPPCKSAPLNTFQIL